MNKPNESNVRSSFRLNRLTVFVLDPQVCTTPARIGTIILVPDLGCEDLHLAIAKALATSED